MKTLTQEQINQIITDLKKLSPDYWDSDIEGIEQFLQGDLSKEDFTSEDIDGLREFLTPIFEGIISDTYPLLYRSLRDLYIFVLTN